MSGQDLSEVQAFALASELRRIAPEHADLADSLSFGRRMAAVSPGAPDYEQRLRAELRAAGRQAREEIAADQAAEAARQAAEAQRQVQAAQQARQDPRRQWTAEDVRDASLPELNAAYARGQLTEQTGAAPPRPPKRALPERPPAPSAQENARWKAMPPWQAQRARAAWMAANMPEPALAAPAPSYPHVPDGRRLTNEQLAARASHRARLTPDFAGAITAEDLAVAQPAVVESWMNAGKLEHLGVPPQHRHGVRT